MPGWTASYGIDLHEWVNADQFVKWRDYMHSQLGWPHMLGARTGPSAKDKRLRKSSILTQLAEGKPVSNFTQLAEGMDYASYQQFRPDYAHYVKAIGERPTMPAFSEDRFRIREGDKWAWKRYTYEMTRRGLRHSMMAGGVANIWGNFDANFGVHLRLPVNRESINENPTDINDSSHFQRERDLRWRFPSGLRRG